MAESVWDRSKIGGIEYTNDPAFIARHPNMIAINNVVMVNFSGQIAH
ncbi:hypothetical protein ASZ90_019876 [hydrocarbon metagenome]|uniref:Acetyl-CoA hydrolase/transferase C-terminal domain-containing protein n=1 Tax=hydrocarbon metagenome TaxID=938273 RepID=A0A0W8E284_9ZZZZ